MRDVLQENFKQDLREYVQWLAAHPGRHTAWEVWQAACEATRNPGLDTALPPELLEKLK